MIDDEHWFVAKNVCAVQGLTNPTVALAALDKVTKFNLGGLSGDARALNELGLYSISCVPANSTPSIAGS